MKKFNLTVSFVFFFVFLSVSQNEKKPNIIFLLADDLGYGELGVYGQEKIKTPFLDALSKEGMLFTNFYAGNALCSPSRAVLMTGINSGKNSIRGNIGFHPDRKQFDRVSIKPNETTLAEMLKPAGYETIYFGKWHLDDPYHLETWAANRGFDYAVQGQWKRRNGNVEIDSNYDWINGLQGAIKYDYKKYSCMDEFRTTQAIDYFEKRENNEDPFFLFMSYRIPHGHEVDIRNKTMYNKNEWPEIERLHAARITMLDEQVGRLMRYLEVTGRLENTLIVFTSDNGGQKENGHNEKFFKSNGEYRGAKRDLYEGGLKVPTFAIWKNIIQKGTTNNHISAFQDVMPTLAEVAGIEPPTNDGISMLPTLLGKENQKKHTYLYWELHLNQMKNNGNDKGFRQAVLQNNWKAVRYGLQSKTELYNLDNDKSETKDISNQFPEKVKELEKLFKKSSTVNKNFFYGGNPK